jgi:hypothetical protein
LPTTTRSGTSSSGRAITDCCSKGHDLVATGTTGTLLEDALGVGVEKLQPGPLGGDQQARGPRPIMISSPLMTSDYVRTVPDNGDYLNRSFE